jgi:hypothetical protein
MPTMNDTLRSKLNEGLCPDCGGFIFRPGPRGGIAQNIECLCGSRFNVARYTFKDSGDTHLIMAERIPSEKDGGGAWREDMFPRVLE